MPLDPSPSDAKIPRRLRVFSWGYEGWGNATRQLIRAVDLAEGQRGFAPPVFVDVRLSRSVRAIGFRERAFEQLLGHERYRWMPSLGNPTLRNPRAGRQVNCPEAAHQLLDLALDAARCRRRVIFFCSCPCPDWREKRCHRFQVAKHLRHVARQRHQPMAIEEWPGGRLPASSIPLRTTAASFAAVIRGRQSVPLPAGMAVQQAAGLPWGSILELSAGNSRQLIAAGPALFQRGMWVLPVFLQPLAGERQRHLLRAVRAERRAALLDPRT